jgi:signal peptidase I
MCSPVAAKKPLKLGRKLWRQWRITILLIVFVIVPVRSSLADWNWVPSSSMNPTILEGDLIFVDKMAYDLRVPLTLRRLAEWSGPQRGDIVVCLSPTDGTRLVKRVIAVPGDTVEMRRNVLFLNGQALTYSQAEQDCVERLPERLVGDCVCALEELDRTIHPVLAIPSIQAVRDFGPVEVTDNHYFVLGDNRDLSRDSRFFGLVPRRSILGKAKAVIVSFDITDKCQPRLGRFLAHLQ